MYSREITEELNRLSVAVFNTKSKWKKMIDMGVTEPVMEDTKRLTLKDGNKEEYETVRIQKTYVSPNGVELPLFRLNHYTVDTVRDFMIDILGKREQIRQALKKFEDDKKTEELKKQVSEQASGTAV